MMDSKTFPPEAVGRSRQKVNQEDDQNGYSACASSVDDSAIPDDVAGLIGDEDYHYKCVGEMIRCYLRGKNTLDKLERVKDYISLLEFQVEKQEKTISRYLNWINNDDLDKTPDLLLLLHQ